MIIKNRSKPLTLKILESLNYRTVLNTLEKKEYSNQKKGFEGELVFDAYTKSLSAKSLVINDLRIKDSGQMIQIDCLILNGNTISLYEVKNYVGRYDYKNGVLQGRSDFIITNPLNQLYRTQPILYNLVRKLGFHMEINPQVVFINPDFYLYELPRNKPFIFANQLPHHFEQLAKQPTWVTENQRQLAYQLCAMHIENYRPSDLPLYDFFELKKGVCCPKCFSFYHINKGYSRICTACGHKESVSDAIIRSTEECHLLFPELKVTKRLIYEWCGEIYTEQRVQRILSRQYLSLGNYKSAYYDVNSLLLIK